MNLSVIRPALKCILASASLALIAPACSGEKDDISGSPAEISAISDSLRAGNMPGAMRLAGDIKATALLQGDSMRWSEAMVEQGVIAYYQRDPRTLATSADSAIRWLERHTPDKNKARILAKAYQTYGSYFDQYHYNADSTAKYLRKAVDYAELSGIRSDLPQYYGNYANTMRLAGSLDSAAIYYHRAISIADSLTLPEANYIPLYNGIAGVFSDMHDFDNGLIWWNKSMDIYGVMDQYDKFNTLSGLANLYYYKGDYRDAERVLTRLDNLLDSIPESTWERMFNNINLADTYIRLGRVGEAMPILEKSSEFFTTRQPNPMVVSYIHTLLIRAATSAGDYAEGKRVALTHPESDTLRLEQHVARLKALEDLYASSGDYSRAYSYRTRHDAVQDSLRSYKLRQRISALNLLYQRDRRILNLQTENTRQSAHIYKLIAAVAIAVAVIVVLVLMSMMRRYNARKREDRMMNKIIKLREENLRNRVTPHFIYNALNQELFRKTHGEESHLESLLNLIRRQQYAMSDILIPFAEELRFVDDYIDVIGANCKGRLRYTCLIDPVIDTGLLFPSMALQILVENAFKHGFRSLPAEVDRRLEIEMRPEKDNRVSVTVTNNCGPDHTDTDHKGTGLRVLLETMRLIKEKYHEEITFSHCFTTSPDGEIYHKASIHLSTEIKK
ncbi:MAG: histidine kinase [Muribaculaceae bacterium]|nr:histidine kinase [Muribaculaceae bacterium]